MKDQDDFDDFDSGIDAGGSGGDDTPASAGNVLQAAWENGPMLKIAAALVGVGVLYGAYSMIFTEEIIVENKSMVSADNLSEAKVVPGQEATDKLYSEAVAEKNKEDLERAIKTGESAIPVPVATTKSEGIEMPDAEKSSEDPLAEWRQNRMAAQQQEVKEPEATISPVEVAAPETVIPLVTPPPPQQLGTNPAMPQAQIQGQGTNVEAIRALSEQMRTIVAAQAPADHAAKDVTKVLSPYVEAQEAKKAAQAQTGMSSAGVTATAADSLAGDVTGDQSASAAPEEAARGKVIMSAGKVVYAQMINELNSDIAGPALAQIMSGPFAGGRAVGSFSVRGDYLTVTFDKIVKDDVIYKINGIAVDQKTTLTGMQTSIDRHYFSRVILPAATQFLQGYAQALSQTGQQTTVTAGGGAVQDNPAPSPEQSIYQGLAGAATSAGQVFMQDSQRPFTIVLARGTTLGILLLDSVTTTSIEQ